ncbi:transporter substrate-binding domain-containing protein [Arenibacterium sp. LLYu02]|uniref:transporter substrate-binding domain-containing protein n=1 Tax=Arenibacterium sp. LLYu02 TaxID=3404132 RepID=UPI003B225302
MTCGGSSFTRRVAALLLAFWFGVLCGIPLAFAQEVKPLVVPWTEAPPLMGRDDEGNPEGFSIDLARALAEILGRELEFKFYNSIPEVVAAQNQGEAQLLSGVATGPALEPNNLVSDPVARVQIRLGVPVENMAHFSGDQLEASRIAVVPPTLGSDPALLPGATLVPFTTPESALLSVLNGANDAIAYPVSALFSMMRAARLDGRLGFVGGPILDSTRHVILHKSQADLLPEINAAIADLEANGKLEDLRIRYLMNIPEPVPEVLTVGIHRVPPFVDLTEDGEPTGFGVEVLQDLADLAGLQLTFKQITDAEFGRGPRAGAFDLVPMMASNEDRATRMDFTFSTHRVPFSIFTLKTTEAAPETLADLRGLTVAVEKGKNTAQLAEDFGGLTLVYVEGKDGTMNALLSGEAQALLSPTDAFWTHVTERGTAEQFKASAEPFWVTESGPALRLGLGEVRERLNAVIPGYLISNDYLDRQTRWFGTPEFWTEARLRMLVGAISAFVLILMGFAIWQKVQRSRSREREERLLAHSRQLEVLVDELERSNRELDSFADIASHDLKEPLRAITWQVRSLQDATEQGAEGAGEVARIGALCAQMEETISALLSSSQHRGKGKDRGNIHMDALLEEIRGDLAELKQATGGRLLIETPLPKVFASRAKIKVVFQNLIANGFIHNNSAKPVVRVGYLTADSADPSGLIHVFYVRDNGVGVAPEDYMRIFQPGVRGTKVPDKVLPGATGSGLGLSFVKEIVESYGQLITLDSTPGQGTTFYFSLPNPMSSEGEAGEQTATVDVS